jgi:uncharacterized alkaline shock family protein YloU
MDMYERLFFLKKLGEGSIIVKRIVCALQSCKRRFIMDCKINLELGTLTVADEVIATVAGNTCVECYGIVGMGTKRATDGIVEMFKKDSLTKGVKVVAGEGSVSISVSVVLEYGVSMQAVSKAVIDNIKYNIETMIGVKVEKINVIVVGIRV